MKHPYGYNLCNHCGEVVLRSFDEKESRQNKENIENDSFMNDCDINKMLRGCDYDNNNWHYEDNNARNNLNNDSNNNNFNIDEKKEMEKEKSNSADKKILYVFCFM